MSPLDQTVALGLCGVLMTIARVREREVESKIVVSEGEIDNYLADESGKGASEEYQMAHILLRAPESASPEQIQKLKAKAEQVLDRLKAPDRLAERLALLGISHRDFGAVQGTAQRIGGDQHQRSIAQFRRHRIIHGEQLMPRGSGE